MTLEELKRVPLYISFKDLHDLDAFIDEAILGASNSMPINKLNRWLGYIQGILIAARITDVETERNYTRPLFRPLDFSRFPW